MTSSSALAVLLLFTTVWYSASCLFQIYVKESVKNGVDPFIITSTQHSVCGALGLAYMVAVCLTCYKDKFSTCMRTLRDRNMLLIALLFTFGNLLTNMALCSGKVWFVHVVKATEPVCSAVLMFIATKQVLPLKKLLALLMVICGSIFSVLDRGNGGVESDTSSSSFTAGLFLIFSANWFLQSRNVLIALTDRKNEHVCENEAIEGKAKQMQVLDFTNRLGTSSIENSASSGEFASVLNSIENFLLVSIPSAIISMSFQILASLLSGSETLKDIAPLTFSILNIHSAQSKAGVAFLTYQMSSFCVLGFVSPVTHSLLNCVKRIFIIVVASVLMGDSLGANILFGLCLIFTGLVFYGIQPKQRIDRMWGDGKKLFHFFTLIPMVWIFFAILSNLEIICPNSYGIGIQYQTHTVHVQASTQRDGQNEVSPNVSSNFELKSQNYHLQNGNQFNQPSFVLKGKEIWHAEGGTFFLPHYSPPPKSGSHVVMSGVEKHTEICAYICNSTNAGDFFNRFLIPVISGKLVDDARSSTCLKQRPVLYATGSMFAVHSGTKMPKYVWGTGVISAEGKIHREVLQASVVATRGPVTCARLQKDSKSFRKKSKNEACPVPLGDPGLLISSFYKPKNTGKKYDICFIPHYIHHSHPLTKFFCKMSASKSLTSSIHVLNILSGAFELVNQIVRCRFVLSSSLHGIIFSDSYNIPNAHAYIDKSVRGKHYKFEDYFGSVKREYSARKSLYDIGLIVQRIDEEVSINSLEDKVLLEEGEKVILESNRLREAYEKPSIDLLPMWNAAPFHAKDLKVNQEKQNNIALSTIKAFVEQEKETPVCEIRTTKAITC